MAPLKKTLRTWTSGLLAAVLMLVFTAPVARAQEGETTPPAATSPAIPAPGEGTGLGTEFAPTKDPAIEQIQKLYDAPAAPTPQTSAPAQPESLTRQALKVFAVLAILCGAIILLGYVSRKYLPKTRVLAGLRLGSVMGRVHLTPKASLHYVKTGGRVLVLGVTPAGIHLITEFEAETFEAAVSTPSVAEPTGQGPNFLEFLSSAQRGGRAGSDEEFANLRGEIQRLSEFLREAGREQQG